MYKLQQSFCLKNTIDYEKRLNPQQLKVVREGDGPCLVLAGAGSGKTRVLIYRLAYLLEKEVNPQNILLVTFTNKAAREMISRAEALIKMDLSLLWAGTFHHIGNRILRQEAHHIGYTPDFTIIDREDSCDLIEDCLEELGYNRNKTFPNKRVVANIRSLAINSLKEVEQVIINYYSYLEEFVSSIKRVIHYYESKKKEANIMDFDDLLIKWLEILKVEEVKQRYARNFFYILVDEYQDTNRLQFEILRKISFYHNNILVVGDDAQSIYSFRAADINNTLDFPKVFPQTKIFKLEINYRSTPQILDLANNIIKHNVDQFPKNLIATNKGGRLPVVVKTKDIFEQAKFVAQRILDLTEEGIPLKEIVVLFRSRYQSLELEMELLKRNIPYTVRGGLRFFEQAHIKDILSYLKIVVNSKDELSFKRAISLHQGIGRLFAHKIWEQIVKEGKNFDEVYKKLPKGKKESFKLFWQIIEKIKQVGPEEAVREIMKYYRDYCFLNFDDPEDRIMDIEEIAKLARNYPTVRDFLIDLSSYEEFKGETLVSPYDRGGESLILSTIHQAKGLEWYVVFLIGFNDYEFPHPKAINDIEALQEERRLFYVAVTRAKQQLYITYSQSRWTARDGLIITRPSMFLYEIPPTSFEEWRISS